MSDLAATEERGRTSPIVSYRFRPEKISFGSLFRKRLEWNVEPLGRNGAICEQAHVKR
jgi:hypothetical protein